LGVSPDVFLRSITAASRAVKGAVDRELAATGVRAGQQMLLRCLWEHDGATAGELVACVGVEQPTVTQAINRLVSAGFVERRHDPGDGRLVRVYLTDRGRSVRDGVEVAQRQVVKRALRGLSTTDRQSLVTALDRVHTNLIPEARSERP